MDDKTEGKHNSGTETDPLVPEPTGNLQAERLEPN